MQIVNPLSVDRSLWQSFVDNHPNGTIFHTPFIFDAYDIARHHPFALFALDSDNSIQAMLVGFVNEVIPGPFSSLTKRAIVLHSPIYYSVNALKELMETYLNTINKQVIYSEIRNHTIDNEYNDVVIGMGFTREGHYNIVKKMPENEKELWNGIGRKRKDGINKAKKFNFSFVESHDKNVVNDFYCLLFEQYRKIRLPHPDKQFFMNLLNLDSDNNCRFFQLSENNEIMISLCAFKYKHVLYAFYIGISQNAVFIRKRPVDWFYFEVMKWCMNNDVEYFDWMGAGKPGDDYGVRDFKKQYGGYLVDYGRFKYVHSKIKFFFAELGFKIVQKMIT